MPRNPESEERKNRIVSLLEQRIGPLRHKYHNRHDWYFSKNDKVEVFITDSKAHFHERPWFDMKDSDIKELATHPAGFIVFILGNADNYLVVPAQHLNEELKNYIVGRRKAEKGFYHFNLRLGGQSFTQLPNWKLYSYAEKIELIPLALEEPILK
jgi:hypothetical protein